MGWTYTSKGPLTTKEFFEREFNYDKPAEGKSGKVIAFSATWTTAYMAFEIKTPEKREVIGLVCLIHHVPNARDGYTFGYKDMDETMGPNESRCPATILNLLTNTTSQYALEWRARCWERINKHKAAPRVHKGDLIKFGEPIAFRNGEMHDVLRWMRGNTFYGSGYSVYHISNWRERKYQNLGQHSFDKLGG